VIKFVWIATGQWFSHGALVSSTNKTDHHDITEILLKVALNNHTLWHGYTGSCKSNYHTIRTTMAPPCHKTSKNYIISFSHRNELTLWWKFVSDLRQVGGFSRYSDFLNQ
jgi:hypothetical protein